MHNDKNRYQDMKLFRFTALLSIAAMLMAGCRNEDLHLDPNDQSATRGYLSLSTLNVECVVDHKPVDENVRSTAATRATVNIDDFTCTILNEAGEVIKSFTYGNRPTEKIELEGGNYIFQMSSGTVPGAAWESPVYGLEEPFKIVRKETTTLTNLVCTLQNIQVSVSYSADLRAALSDDTTATISIEENSLVYGVDESRSGYFKAVNALNDINVLVKGKYTPEGKEAAAFEMTATIPDVKAGQYSDINFYIEYSGEGSISIGATIDGWVVDEEIVYDFSLLLSENTIVDDEDKPVITLADGDIDTPVSLYASDFDDRGNCLKPIIIDIAAENAIAGLTVDISSTNGDFISSLSTYNIPQVLDMCNAGTATSALQLMGYAVNSEVLGATSLSYELTAQMKLLKEFGGTHSFKVTVTDEKGGKSEKTLAIVIEGGSSGPSVVWTGYDLSKRYTVTSDLTVDIVVTAPSGIASFIVNINSEVLDAKQLAGVGLCDQLDLVTPENSIDTTNPDGTNTSEIRQSLINLGFPVGDDVKDQTKLEFSITKFLGLLQITGAGEHDFMLTVTDNDGNTTSKTLMLVTE